MRITRHETFDELAPWRGRWNELARELPFRRWEWLASWWMHYCEYGLNKSLLLLAAWEESRLIGLAPWYVSRLWPDGKAIRPLGSGEACSEYSTVLCESGFEDGVAGIIAEWLMDASSVASDDGIEWDRLELLSAAGTDTVIPCLLHHLSQQGNSVYSRQGPNCWRIDLPDSWEEFVSRLSKSHRKQVRRAARRLSAGEVFCRVARNDDELDRGFRILVDLHQRRWTKLGQRGCFGSSRFLDFHRECAPRLFRAGCLDLIWLELDGRPLAAEYHLINSDTAYAYQAGIDPDRLGEEPGRLALVATMQHHIAQGRKHYDLLRGNEPYKSHWRAVSHPMVENWVIPQRASARLRQGVLAATDSVKNWIRSGLEFTGLR
jgi:CelD/BcsL family acetyltransferase involved in cellulose biosynthesis